MCISKQIEMITKPISLLRMMVEERVTVTAVTFPALHVDL